VPLGDGDAAKARTVGAAQPEEEPAIIAPYSLGPILKVIEGERSTKDAIAAMRERIIAALHDANEAVLGEILLAA
jgi:hypothetical protein